MLEALRVSAGDLTALIVACVMHFLCVAGFPQPRSQAFPHSFIPRLRKKAVREGLCTRLGFPQAFGGIHATHVHVHPS